MADRPIRMAPRPPVLEGTLVAAAGPLTAAGEGYASATAATQTGLDRAWREQAWAYFETIGPLNYAINWRAQAMSRVCLHVAEVMPDSNEPVTVESGAAVDILRQLKWDESRIMSDATIQLDVAGRGYLVGRDVAGVREWCIYSADQVRLTQAARSGRTDSPTYEIQEYPGARWEPITGNSLVTVIRHADPRQRWRDTSNVRAALVILREIDLYNREIVSTLVSRIANNGLLLVPQEMSFPARKANNDSQDPFMLELIEAARQSLKDPGSASAAIPMPLKVPAQFIDKFVHLKLGDVVDGAVLTARQDAYGRLADTINLPREIITGISDVNHSAGLTFDLDQAAIKLHISPTAEVITRALTTGFLYPQLLANREPLTGPGGGRLVVWYDTAELAMQPDLSGRAIELYDRVEISGDALRRETGFSEDDKPNEKEVREQILKAAAKNAQLALTAIAELTGISSTRSTGGGGDAGGTSAEADAAPSDIGAPAPIGPSAPTGEGEGGPTP